MINKTRRNALLQAIEGLSSWSEIHVRWGSYNNSSGDSLAIIVLDNIE